ncbi:MAG: peptide deformylase [Solirubrobacteraceae bacterium]
MASHARRSTPSDEPLAGDEFEVEPVDEVDGSEPSEEGEERELDPEVAARRAAALARIRKFGDPVLRTRARPVQRFDEELAVEVEHMGRLMGDALGVGLAATQVGVLHRLLVYRVGPEGPIAALVNPEIEWKGRETEILEEGCLSLPRVLLDVERPIHVRVRGQDEEGSPLMIEASGLEARVIQHEIDHLDGVLILDRASREARKEAMRALREAAQADEAA